MLFQQLLIVPFLFFLYFWKSQLLFFGCRERQIDITKLGLCPQEGYWFCSIKACFLWAVRSGLLCCCFFFFTIRKPVSLMNLVNGSWNSIYVNHICYYKNMLSLENFAYYSLDIWSYFECQDWWKKSVPFKDCFAMLRDLKLMILYHSRNSFFRPMLLEKESQSSPSQNQPCWFGRLPLSHHTASSGTSGRTVRTNGEITKGF